MPKHSPATSDVNLFYLAVALDVPLLGLFDYSHNHAVQPGQRVLVRFGRRQLIGMVWQTLDRPNINPTKIKPIEAVLTDLEPMPDSWLRLVDFAANYYHRAPGEVAIPVLPAPLRKSGAYTGARSQGGPVARASKRKINKTSALKPASAPVLNPVQADVLAQIQTVFSTAKPKPVLLHGITGSGKTEIYLRLAQQTLAQGQQVLFMVPEINLTPQFERTVRTRLSTDYRLAVMHSRISDGARLQAWLQAANGQANILLGTRMAIFTPMPRLGLIVVDEEHDGSYKQQEGLRYSARDLAVWRGHDLQVPVILGSATPALETYLNAQRNTYHLYELGQRALNQQLPQVILLDTNNQKLQQGLAEQSLQAITTTLAQNQQALVFINRRGYAPVLRCPSCAWISQCDNCSAHTVLHRQSQQQNFLQCHHCGLKKPVPFACPQCGDPDIRPLGQGTQRIEEFLEETFPQTRILRIDADATRRKGSMEALLAQIHSGIPLVIVGTQMLAKGHDFAKLGLVVVLNSDSMLFAQDYRAPERLFAQLMQVAGRAGRHSAGAKVLVQTDYPQQMVYQSLQQHDYQGFAAASLAERAAFALPPYSFHALLTAQARKLGDALNFLQAIRAQATALNTPVKILDAVPLRMVRVDKVERAQMLFEASQRKPLHALLNMLIPITHQLAHDYPVRWGIEIDPAEI